MSYWASEGSPRLWSTMMLDYVWSHFGVLLICQVPAPRGLELSSVSILRTVLGLSGPPGYTYTAMLVALVRHSTAVIASREQNHQFHPLLSEGSPWHNAFTAGTLPWLHNAFTVAATKARIPLACLERTPPGPTRALGNSNRPQ